MTTKDPRPFKARVYALTDETGTPFYVGCTTSPIHTRFGQHLSDARKERYWANQKKVEKIISLGLRIKIEILEIVEVEAVNAYQANRQGRAKEREWIKKFKDQGIELCNGNWERPIPEPKEEYVGLTLSSFDKVA